MPRPYTSWSIPSEENMPLLSAEIMSGIYSPNKRRQTREKALATLANPTKLDTQQLIEAWAIVGECYRFDKEPERSEEAYLKALQVIQSTRNDLQLGQCYFALGDALFFCNSYTKAIPYFREAADVFERLNNVDELLVTLSQTAWMYREMGQGEEERNCLLRAMLVPDDYPLSKPNLLERFACSLSESGQHQEAIKIFEEALSDMEAIPSHRYWNDRLGRLAEIYCRAGDEVGAERTLKRRH